MIGPWDGVFNKELFIPGKMRTEGSLTCRGHRELQLIVHIAAADVDGPILTFSGYSGVKGTELRCDVNE